MILVDSSVWIDFFRGRITPATQTLDAQLGQRAIATGDLILTEVLQGIHNDKQFELVRRLLTSLDIAELGGQRNAIQAAQHYRMLRRNGVTVRKTMRKQLSFCKLS